MRSRAVPRGTVGGRMAGTSSPSRAERCGDRDRFRARPDHERLNRGVRRQKTPAPGLQALPQQRDQILHALPAPFFALTSSRLFMSAQASSGGDAVV